MSSANLNLRTGSSQSVSQNNKFHETTLGTPTNQQQYQQQQQNSSVPNQLLQQQQQQHQQHQLQQQAAIQQDQDDEQFNQLNQKMLQLVATIPNYPLQKIVQRWCNDPKSPSESPPNCLNESLQSSPTKTSSKFSISGKYILFFLYYAFCFKIFLFTNICTFNQKISCSKFLKVQRYISSECLKTKIVEIYD